MLYFGPWFYITVANEEKQNTKEKLSVFLAHTNGFTKYQWCCCLSNHKFTSVWQNNWRTCLAVGTEYAVVIELVALLS